MAAARMSWLGDGVRRRRLALGLSQEEVAELAGTSARFVVQVEAGKSSLRSDKVLDVLEVLGLVLEVRLREVGG